MNSSGPTLDLIIRNGMVVDGTGNPWFRADVGIKNGRIATVGRLHDLGPTRVIDARGMVVSPGFIDIHNHSDTSVLVRPTCDSHIMQGVTTMLVGNCGGSAAPLPEEIGGIASPFVRDGEVIRSLRKQGVRWRRFSEYLNEVERRGSSANFASLVGHGTVRAHILGWEGRHPTASELGNMKTLVAEAMADGAFGMSSGLMYPPGLFAKTEELVELTRVLADYGGFHAIHLRDERTNQKYRDSVLECIEIGAQSGAPVQLSHLETHYPNGGMEPEVLLMLDDARARGLDVLCDVPPTFLSFGSLASVLPHWTKDGGMSEMLVRLADDSCRKRIREQTSAERGSGGLLLVDGHWDKIWVAESRTNPRFEGLSLAEIAASRRLEPSYDIVCDLLVEEGRDLTINCALHNECDIQTIVSHPLSMICSDAGVSVSSAARENARTYGAFPITFRRYVRGEGRPDEVQGPGKPIITLQGAVRKMTSLPAQRLGLRDRGVVREGAWADIVVFDPATVADRATVSDPHQYPTGIEYVLVNGQLVVENGKHTNQLPGQVLRHSVRVPHTR